MAARADLLAIADACAAKARELATNEGNGPPALGYAVKWTENAKAALEAAAMAATTRDDFEQAVDDALPRLEALGVLSAEQATALTPAQVLDGLVRTIEALRAHYGLLEQRGDAYAELRALTDRLRFEFTAADTPTALRVAERIGTVHDRIDERLSS